MLKPKQDKPKQFTSPTKTIYRMMDDGKGGEKEVTCQGEQWEPVYWWMSNIQPLQDEIKQYKRLMPWYDANKESQVMDEKPMSDGKKHSQAEHCKVWLHARKTMIGYLGKTLLESPSFERESRIYFHDHQLELISDCIVYFNKNMMEKYGHSNLYRRT